MKRDLSEIALLQQLRELRKGRRRFTASVVTTFSVNFTFYENVVLRYLIGAGSRLNVVLADAGEVAKAFAAESTRPRCAGTDYVLLPISTIGAFHPKVLSLFSDKGMAIAVGSHNLTEAGFGGNAELSVILGFDDSSAPINVAQPVTDYILQCAGQLAPSDASLSARLADRLRSLSLREQSSDPEVTFSGSGRNGAALLDQAFQQRELDQAQRILVLGPYFDNDLQFLNALRARAKKAEIVVALQPDHAVIKRVEKWPAKTRACDASTLKHPRGRAFIHAKAIVIEEGKKLTVTLGSANPSEPAWLEGAPRRNSEAVVTLRGRRAALAFRDLGLGQLWEAPTLGRKELEQIAARSRSLKTDVTGAGMAPVAGLWRNGWVEFRLGNGSRGIKRIDRYDGAGRGARLIEGFQVVEDAVRFPSPSAGVFSVELLGEADPLLVIASSAGILTPSLVSNAAGRLIDELGRLDGGAAPGTELLDLCEKVLLQDDEQKVERSTPRRSNSPASPPPQGEASGPRGISIESKLSEVGGRVHLSLDISAIITLLLKDLQSLEKEKSDPTADEVDDDDEKTEPDEDVKSSKPKRSSGSRREWRDIVNAVRPRISGLLKRLASRLGEDRSPKWKYERTLLALALIKRLRRFYPSPALHVSGRPERLVNDAQVRQAFKLAMRCWFTREVGIVGALDRAGGVDVENDVIGRALLLWAAYEAGTDAAQAFTPGLHPDEVRVIQCDRTDAIIAAIAAAASPAVVDRAKQELFDRGEWRESRDSPDRLAGWFERHSQLGLSLQRGMSRKQPASLPLVTKSPSMRDILVWKAEPGWPRLPQLISGKSVHLCDVGDTEPLKVVQQFVEVVDLRSMGIASL
jgi:hypothetical protein